MKITEKKLRHIVREVLLENREELLAEGWFSGALKGMVRSLPFGNELADAHSSKVMEKLGDKIDEMDKRIKKLEAAAHTH